MPKQTFFNLPGAKRQTIEQAALDEFSEHGFDHSNMNRIVKQSKIAKGSFYQYFDDKKDLYFHLIDTLVVRKMRAMEPILGGYRANGFAHNLEELFRLGLAFADSDPKLYRLGEDFATRQTSFTQEYIRKYNPIALDVYGKLLEHAREAGELREDVDLPLAKAFINALINQTIPALIGRPKGEWDHVIAQLLSFIERAILK